jgi:hypothetical protein
MIRSRLSFNITNSKDFLAKLLEDFEDFKKDDTSSRLAINCAMTAWHLSDWIYFEYKFDKVSKLFDFQESIKSTCPSLQVMHDITNGSKHFKLTKHQPKVAETKLHGGSFDKSFDRSFDISTLDVEMKDGSKKYFEDELQKVINFWTNYFEETLKL